MTKRPAPPPAQQPEPLPDFDNAQAYAVALAGRGNVVTIVGRSGVELVARGYLGFDEARKLRDALTRVVGPSEGEMALLPIETMPPELKNGRGLMLYGRHANDSGRGDGFRKGDHWWAIAVWDVWREAMKERWVYALNGEPLSWGEPTHYCEMKPP
jgi:hypothetical protein